MNMDEQVLDALREDLIERFEPQNVWFEDMGFRLVFKEVKTKTGYPRSVSYIDVFVREGRISCQAADRSIVVVDYRDPKSLEIIDEFIAKRSAKAVTSQINRIRSLQAVHRKCKAEGGASGSDCLANKQDVEESPLGEASDDGRLQHQKHRRDYVWETQTSRSTSRRF